MELKNFSCPKFCQYCRKNIDRQRQAWKKQTAFTLAEILIVLAIIGVVAAMTIPTLINKIQKQKTVTALKKQYSIFSQAIKLSQLDNDTIKDWNWGKNGTSFTATKAFNTYWKPYLKVLKVCHFPKDCGYSEPIATTHFFSSFAGDLGLGILSDGTRTLFSLTDGTIAIIVSQVTGKNYTDNHIVVIDINGAKKPNCYGIDVFVFRTSENGLIPYGTAAGCSIDSSSCAAKIMADGWQIKDDYPWK